MWTTPIFGSRARRGGGAARSGRRPRHSAATLMGARKWPVVCAEYTEGRCRTASGRCASSRTGGSRLALLDRLTAACAIRGTPTPSPAREEDTAMSMLVLRCWTQDSQSGEDSAGRAEPLSQAALCGAKNRTAPRVLLPGSNNTHGRRHHRLLHLLCFVPVRNIVKCQPIESRLRRPSCFVAG
ncbi:hypothetical protein FA95DRAFT_1313653 [Auriscalpium vulgare]|uniref:Uncharacterized protein n=1 Tax=Auriscalpium vulgare TaxID=40419 RepID=A0ACB8R1S8_9AGAM|nr:hypothetical protein FA95DRAFT_1313653 [Auriscalpium vulgare]